MKRSIQKHLQQQGGFQGLTALESDSKRIPLMLCNGSAMGQQRVVTGNNNRNSARRGILRIDKQTGVKKFPLNLGLAAQSRSTFKGKGQQRTTDGPFASLTPVTKRKRVILSATSKQSKSYRKVYISPRTVFLNIKDGPMSDYFFEFLVMAML